MGMGFGMKKIIWFSLLAILVPVLVFGFLGCMKKPDHTPNYGPEVTFTDIQKAAVNEVPPDPESMKAGQYVSLETTQVLDTQSPVTLAQRLDELTSRSTAEDEKQTGLIKWLFTITLNELSPTGQWQQSVDKDRQLSMEVASSTTVSPQNSTMSAKAPIGIYSLKALQTSDEQAPVKITYHNLKREDGFLPVPILVKKKADCGGVKDCDRGLRFMRLSFDRVIWDSDDHGTKTTYRITYSPDIPTYIADWSNPEGIYPTNQYEFCAQTWIEVDNGTQKQVVPVQQCKDIRDFQF
jgi:hypothetical protein